MVGENWIEIARVEDVPPGSVHGARANGRMLALVNVDGVIHALDGVCPHMKGPLSQGAIWHGQLECPWHHFRYDPTTGRNTYPANVYPDDVPQLQEQLAPLCTFPVRVEDGKVMVSFTQGTKI
ncbi:MAG TPA: Rieske (2Fe-2S) protein [Candidatus Acidoferrales bacterium]|nr:Rieske (2Fe-2S) protein [Candidatus Acidoferrales bacterium]